MSRLQRVTALVIGLCASAMAVTGGLLLVEVTATALDVHAAGALLLLASSLLFVGLGIIHRGELAAWRLGVAGAGVVLIAAAVAVAPESGTGNQLSHTLALAGHAVLGPFGLALIAIGLWPPKGKSEHPSPIS